MQSRGYIAFLRLITRIGSGLANVSQGFLKVCNLLSLERIAVINRKTYLGLMMLWQELGLRNGFKEAEMLWFWLSFIDNSTALDNYKYILLKKATKLVFDCLGPNKAASPHRMTSIFYHFLLDNLAVIFSFWCYFVSSAQFSNSEKNASKYSIIVSF